MSAADERRAWTQFIDGPAAVEKESKYHAKQSGKYASRHEADVAAKLHALASAGVLWDLREQVHIKLVEGDSLMPRGITYVADFVYSDREGEHVLDAKGFKTPEYKLKRSMAWLLHGIRIEEV